MHFSGGYLGLIASALSLAAAGPLAERAGNFNNPVLWQDYPDLEIIRIGDVFYYTSSTFAYSPGAPVLKSYDLVNWTPVSHSMPTVPGSKYNSNGGYVKGIWASSLRYRNSTDTFHWIGCIDGRTYIQTASGTNAAKNNGEVSNWDWKAASSINSCYYDCGLMVDNDDTIYVAYGNTKINVAQLSKDGLSQVKTQQVYSDGTTIEGSRMYRIKDWYYIAVTRPASEEWILKSKSPWGPYEKKVLIGNTSPIASSGAAHQGGLIDTKDGKWYYAAFLDAYPGGRIPVLAPLTWSSDGWPSVVKDGNSWGKSYPMPVDTGKTVPPITGTDNFQGSALSHEWEWNHNPDTSKYKLAGGDGGLILQTATVTSDIFQARNTITRRILGPKSMGTVKLDISQMKDGDRAGACLFRDVTAYIGVHKDGSSSKLVMVNGITLNGNTGSAGKIAATGPTLAAGTTDLWLRIQADITPAFGTSTLRQATFWYSTDGTKFTQLGPSFGMTNAWQYFTGYRYSVFNFASKALGGQVTAKSFTLDKI